MKKKITLCIFTAIMISSTHAMEADESSDDETKKPIFSFSDDDSPGAGKGAFSPESTPKNPKPRDRKTKTLERPKSLLPPKKDPKYNTSRRSLQPPEEKKDKPEFSSLRNPSKPIKIENKGNRQRSHNMTGTEKTQSIDTVIGFKLAKEEFEKKYGRSLPTSSSAPDNLNSHRPKEKKD